MTVRVDFYLGPAVSLTSRVFKVTRHTRSGDDTMPTPTVNSTLAGDTESVSVPLPSNQIWFASLTDTKTSGEISATDIMYFNTGSLQFPGPERSGRLRILGMEEMSSSSDSSS